MKQEIKIMLTMTRAELHDLFEGLVKNGEHEAMVVGGQLIEFVLERAESRAEERENKLRAAIEAAEKGGRVE